MKGQIDFKKNKEEKENICIRIINENLRNVRMGTELTMPLVQLNRNCEFRKKYDEAFDIWEADKIRAENTMKSREYNQSPRGRARQKEWYHRNKERIKVKRLEWDKSPARIAWRKAYSKKPEVIAMRKKRQQRYYQRPEVKARIKKWKQEYNQRPEVKARIKEYQKRNKEEISIKTKKYYQNNKEKFVVRWKKAYQARKNSKSSKGGRGK